jgi:hypothetical protein
MRVEFRVDANSLSAGGGGLSKKFEAGFYIAALSHEGKTLSSQVMKLDREFSADA